MVHIPTWLVLNLMVKGNKSRSFESSSILLSEPGIVPLPEGLIFVPSLVSSVKSLFPV